ncbi:MAG: hypothetical protein KBF13_09710, partial [Prevotella sp.]|nr:hypothetical protein [Prevotella sp.]
NSQPVYLPMLCIAQNPTIAAFIFIIANLNFIIANPDFIIANPDFIIANFIFIIANQNLSSRDSWLIEILIVSQIYDKSSGA